MENTSKYNNITQKRKNIQKLFNKETVKKTTVATFLGVVPGSFLIIGAYLVANRLKSNYAQYKTENPEVGFHQWFKMYGYGDMRGYAYENYEEFKDKISKIKCHTEKKSLNFKYSFKRKIKQTSHKEKNHINM